MQEKQCPKMETYLKTQSLLDEALCNWIDCIQSSSYTGSSYSYGLVAYICLK